MVDNYTLANLISDVYRLRYNRNDSEATADERAFIIRAAEFYARDAWIVYNWFFGLDTDDLVVDANNEITLPADCESPLKITNSNGRPLGFTRRGTTTATLLDTGLSDETVTLEYRTDQPTYVVGTETTEIRPELYNYLVQSCIGEIWGNEGQKTKKESYKSDGQKSLLRNIDSTERQQNLRRRPNVRNYRLGR